MSAFDHPENIVPMRLALFSWWTFKQMDEADEASLNAAF